MTHKALVHATDLHVVRGGKTILSGVDLRIDVGEFVVILGANGAGKSTLLNTLSGEIAPTRGDVTIFGERLGDFAPKELARRRAVLPQSSRLDFPLTVREVVALGRAPYPAAPESDEAIIEEAMQAMRITHLADRVYPTCSGGERQRTHFARVLTQLLPLDEDTPKLLMLDEPTASLDMARVLESLTYIRALLDESPLLAVLTILHDAGLAARVADRVVVLGDGGVIADGAPRAALTPSVFERAFGLEVDILTPDHLTYPIIVPVAATHPHTTTA